MLARSLAAAAVQASIMWPSVKRLPKTESIQWLPKSLMVPLPKSHQRYHFGPGKYRAVERPLGRARATSPNQVGRDRLCLDRTTLHKDDIAGLLRVRFALACQPPGPVDPHVNFANRSIASV